MGVSEPFNSLVVDCSAYSPCITLFLMHNTFFAFSPRLWCVHWPPSRPSQNWKFLPRPPFSSYWK